MSMIRTPQLCSSSAEILPSSYPDAKGRSRDDIRKNKERTQLTHFYFN